MLAHLGNAYTQAHSTYRSYPLPYYLNFMIIRLLRFRWSLTGTLSSSFPRFCHESTLLQL